MPSRRRAARTGPGACSSRAKLRAKSDLDTDDMGLFQRKPKAGTGAVEGQTPETAKSKWSRRPASTSRLVGRADRQTRRSSSSGSRRGSPSSRLPPCSRPSSSSVSSLSPSAACSSTARTRCAAASAHRAGPTADRAQVKEFTIDYTQCEFVATSAFAPIPSASYDYHVGNTDPIAAPQWSFTSTAQTASNVGTNRVCRVQFSLPVDMTAPVFMYYKCAPSLTTARLTRAVTNYYQNHRRYVKSIDQSQLKGAATSASTLQNGDCKPVAVEGTLPVYPCGLIANSVFNGAFPDA